MNIIERAQKVLAEIDAKLAWMEKDTTPGPWHWVDSNTDEPVDYAKPDPNVIAEAQDEYLGAMKSLRTVWEKGEGWQRLPKFFCETDEIRKADATFIAASPTGWPTALRCLKTAIEGLLYSIEIANSILIIAWGWEGDCGATARAEDIRDSSTDRLTTLCETWEASQI